MGEGMGNSMRIRAYICQVIAQEQRMIRSGSHKSLTMSRACRRTLGTQIGQAVGKGLCGGGGDAQQDEEAQNPMDGYDRW
jgi:hypothetical protein